ncbi:MAG: hypothetical protein AAFY71_18520 [Bacteroidota bacterium]
MNRYSYFVLMLGFVCLMFHPLYAQETEEKEPKLTTNGYVKYLHNTNFIDLEGNTLSVNLIHNRWNFKYTPNKNWTIAFEARNRVFWGEQLKLDTTFANSIDQYDGLVDLSVRWLDRRSLFIHSIADRAYVDYHTDKWELRVGRQRINWGINTVWNPNDWFNALNFLDFDYEERPGSDAIRFQYFTGILSSLDIAFAPGRSDSTHIGAIKYQFNTGGYDIQLLSGYYRGDLALGLGWAGNIGGAGFKGEGSFFTPLEGLSPDSSNSVQLTVSADYLFGNGIYLSGGILYNSNGNNSSSEGNSVGGNSLAASALSPKNLFPATFSYSASSSYQISPISSVNLSLIYAPDATIPFFTDRHLTLIIPTYTFSIKENWDLDIIGQIYAAELLEQYRHLFSSVNIRLKWSY